MMSLGNLTGRQIDHRISPDSAIFSDRTLTAGTTVPSGRVARGIWYTRRLSKPSPYRI